MAWFGMSAIYHHKGRRLLADVHSCTVEHGELLILNVSVLSLIVQFFFVCLLLFLLLLFINSFASHKHTLKDKKCSLQH